MVRKQRKEVDKKLLEITEKFDAIFKEISEMSYDFIKDLNQEDDKAFTKLYNKYNEKITNYDEEIPILTRKIREFGIF
jgi:uncharacterized membrane protein YgaE (UPF0421/DUF939 family)